MPSVRLSDTATKFIIGARRGRRNRVRFAASRWTRRGN